MYTIYTSGWFSILASFLSFSGSPKKKRYGIFYYALLFALYEFYKNLQKVVHLIFIQNKTLGKRFRFNLFSRPILFEQQSSNAQKRDSE